MSNSESQTNQSLDFNERFRLEKSKTQAKSGRKFLAPSIFQKVDVQGSIF
jgi:hypothetical protein